jgi:hypothetical protein
MRLSTIAVLVGVLVIATSVAGTCQTARSLGMGWTGTGLADDAAAWFWNPAGLPHLDVPAKGEVTKGGIEDLSDIGWQAIAGTDFGGDFDQDVLHLAGVYGNKGFAVGRIAGDDWTELAIAFGAMLDPHFSAGATIRNEEADDWHETMVDLGLMYQWNTSLGKGKPARIGVRLDDATDEEQDIWSAGCSFWIGDRILIAADVYDLANDTEVDGDDDTGTEFNVGAEVHVTDWLALRAGSADGDFGFGVGLTLPKGWKVDAGQLSFDNGDDDLDQQLFCVTKTW